MIPELSALPRKFSRVAFFTTTFMLLGLLLLLTQEQDTCTDELNCQGVRGLDFEKL